MLTHKLPKYIKEFMKLKKGGKKNPRVWIVRALKKQNGVHINII